MHSQSAEKNTTTSEIAALQRANFGGVSIGKEASIEIRAATSHCAIYVVQIPYSASIKVITKFFELGLINTHKK